jgi:hypothetical protein
MKHLFATGATLLVDGGRVDSKRIFREEDRGGNSWLE